MKAVVTITLICIFASIVWMLVGRVLRARSVRRRLVERRSISPRDAYEAEFAKLGIPWGRFEFAWLDVASQLGIDPDRLRSSDRLGELSLTEGVLRMGAVERLITGLGGGSNLSEAYLDEWSERTILELIQAKHAPKS